MSARIFVMPQQNASWEGFKLAWKTYAGIFNTLSNGPKTVEALSLIARSCVEVAQTMDLVWPHLSAVQLRVLMKHAELIHERLDWANVEIAKLENEERRSVLLASLVAVPLPNVPANDVERRRRPRAKAVNQ